MELPRSARGMYAIAAAVAAVVVAIAVLVASTFGSHSTPRGQPALVPLGTDVARFNADFDAACHRVRVLVLLSPT